MIFACIGIEHRDICVLLIKLKVLSNEMDLAEICVNQ